MPGLVLETILLTPELCTADNCGRCGLAALKEMQQGKSYSCMQHCKGFPCMPRPTTNIWPCSYQGDAADLCLDFSIEDETFGARMVHNLLPGGSQLAVTNDNKLHYVHLAADWHLNGRLGASSAAFARGLNQVSRPYTRKENTTALRHCGEKL